MMNETLNKIKEYLGMPVREPYESKYIDMKNVYKALLFGTEPLDIRQMEITE